jgi:hypothetical protein
MFTYATTTPTNSAAMLYFATILPRRPSVALVKSSYDHAPCAFAQYNICSSDSAHARHAPALVAVVSANPHAAKHDGTASAPLPSIEFSRFFELARDDDDGANARRRAASG